MRVFLFNKYYLVHIGDGCFFGYSSMVSTDLPRDRIHSSILIIHSSLSSSVSVANCCACVCLWGGRLRVVEKRSEKRRREEKREGERNLNNSIYCG